MIRKHRGLSQRELAEKIGTTPQYLCNIEKDEKNASMEMLDKICKTLRASICVTIDDK